MIVPLAERPENPSVGDIWWGPQGIWLHASNGDSLIVEVPEEDRARLAAVSERVWAEYDRQRIAREQEE